MQRKLKIFTSILLSVFTLSACKFDSTIPASNNAASASSSSSLQASAAIIATTNTDSGNEASSTASSASSSSDAASSASTTETPKKTTKIVFLGDSQFNNGRDSGTSVAKYVRDFTGFEVYNLGCGGTTASLNPKDNYQSKEPCFINVCRYLKGEIDASIFNQPAYSAAAAVAGTFDPKDVDFYVVEYGINDFNAKRPLSDGKSTNGAVYYVSAMKMGLTWLKELSPNATIILCPPLYAQFWGKDGSFLGDGNVYSNGITNLHEYADNCAQVGRSLGCIVVDTYDGKYMDLNSINAKKWLEKDGIHLTRAGRVTFASVISHFINKKMGYDNSEINSPYTIDTYMTAEDKH